MTPKVLPADSKPAVLERPQPMCSSTYYIEQRDVVIQVRCLLLYYVYLLTI
jgi:hypothetical protein